MTKQEFFQYIASPENLSSNTISILEKLVQEYPYFQIGKMLYLKNMHNENSIEYDKNLSIVSAYSPGGKILYQLIKKKLKTIPQEESIDWTAHEKPAISQPKIVSAHELVKDGILNEKMDEFDELQVLQKEILSEVYQATLPIQEPVVVTDELTPKSEDTHQNLDLNQEYSFNDWLKKISGKNTKVEDADSNKTTEEEVAPQKMHKKDIVNKFILSDIEKIPRKSKSEFYSAEVMAKRSVQDNENIVSETLAGIYLKQGNLPKARRAYEILLIRHPENFYIFAPLLEKIKRLIEEQKAK